VRGEDLLDGAEAAGALALVVDPRATGAHPGLAPPAIGRLDAHEIKLSGWTLLYSSANGSSATKIWSGKSGQTIVAGSDFVVGGDHFYIYSPLSFTQLDSFTSGDLPLAGGAVGLFDPSMKRLDAVGWRGADAKNQLVEQAPAASIPAGQRASRLPNGVDTDDKRHDFVVPHCPLGRPGRTSPSNAPALPCPAGHAP
jgi:hypothetical protein